MTGQQEVLDWSASKLDWPAREVLDGSRFYYAESVTFQEGKSVTNAPRLLMRTSAKIIKFLIKVGPNLLG